MDWWTNVCENTDFVEKVYFPTSEKRKQQWDILTNEIESILKLKQCASILEVCCGTCAVGVSMAKRGHKVTGIDLSESMLSYGKRRADDSNVKIDFLAMNAFDIQTLEKKFDAVLFLDMAFGFMGENEDDDVKLLSGIKKVLKDDGKLLLEVGNLDYYRNKGKLEIDGGFFKYIYKYIESDNTLITEATVDGVDEIRRGVGRLYTDSEMKTLFQSAGFTDINNCISAQSINESANNPSYMLVCK